MKIEYKAIYNNPDHENLSKNIENYLVDYSDCLLSKINNMHVSSHEKQALFINDRHRLLLVGELIKMKTLCISPQIVISAGE